VTVNTISGETITGTIRRIDDFGISMTDAAGEYHYWPRGHVDVQIQDTMEGHRALLPRYTDVDIHNLTAYLLTLK
jgi:hypothetical protein